MTSLSTMGKFEHKVMIIWVWYSHGCTWKIVEENGHCLFFSILFCIFSTTVLKKSQTTLCYDVGSLTSLWNSRNPCWKSEWIFFCNVLKSFWLVSGPWRNWWPVLSTILQTFCYLITILSFCLLLSQQTRDCTNFSHQFIIVNQPSYPSLAGLTVDWLEYKILLHLEILASKS